MKDRRLKLAISLILAGMATLFALPASPAHALIRLTEADPADGAVLEAPAEVVHLCFSQPVNVADRSTFSFTYRMANGRALGMRIVFAPDGSCADLFPGLSASYPAGIYTVGWQVAAADGGETGSGTLRFQVLTEGGSPSPLNPFTPPAFPPTPPAHISPPGETPTAETPTAPAPSASETPPAETTPAAGDPGALDEGDDGSGPDILLTALLTIAVAGGAAVAATLGYLLRRAIGFDPHRPSDGDEDVPAGH